MQFHVQGGSVLIDGYPSSIRDFQRFLLLAYRPLTLKFPSHITTIEPDAVIDGNEIKKGSSDPLKYEIRKVDWRSLFSHLKDHPFILFHYSC